MESLKSVNSSYIKEWSLGPLFGYEHPAFILNHETIILTWIVIVLLALLCIPVQFILKKKDSTIHYIMVSTIRFFLTMAEQTLPVFSFKHFSFIAALFIFIFSCNTLSLFPGIAPDLPWLEEPTTDLNTVFSLSLIAFFYTQFYSIKARGLVPYLKGYLSPFFLMLPINIVGKLSSIISISFRLFGNIFGGSIITGLFFSAIEKSVLYQIVGLVTGMNLLLKLFFGLFEGYLQAFVFTTLTLTYLSMAIQEDGGGH